MHRSSKILVVCHCLLNANAKVFPLARHPGACLEALQPFLSDGVGLVQLPCPETVALGLSRFGMTREQYDTPFLRRACRSMLKPSMDQLAAHAAAGHELVGLVGVNGSPNCGVSLTCTGYTGGEPSEPACDLQGQIEALRTVPGQGVFMQEFLILAEEHRLRLPLMAVDETDPAKLIYVSKP